MTSKNKFIVSEEFQDLFSFDSKEEQIKHDAKIIMARYLSEIERIIEDKNINKKQLAALIETSPSYVTQLFRGNKLLNLETIAKIEDALDVTFQIRAKSNSFSELLDEDKVDSYIASFPIKDGLWAFYPRKEENLKTEEFIPEEKPTVKHQLRVVAA